MKGRLRKIKEYEREIKEDKEIWEGD